MLEANRRNIPYHVTLCSNVSRYSVVSRSVYADMVYAILFRSLDEITVVLFFCFLDPFECFPFLKILISSLK